MLRKLGLLFYSKTLIRGEETRGQQWPALDMNPSGRIALQQALLLNQPASKPTGGGVDQSLVTGAVAICVKDLQYDTHDLATIVV